MFCPRCGDEFREGFDRCADCDVALVASRPPTPVRRGLQEETTEQARPAEDSSTSSEREPREDAPMDAGLVTIGRYFSPFEAEGYRMALEQAGIRAWVFSEPAGTTFLIGVGTRLEVAAQDETAARAVLAA